MSVLNKSDGVEPLTPEQRVDEATFSLVNDVRPGLEEAIAFLDVVPQAARLELQLKRLLEEIADVIEDLGHVFEDARDDEAEARTPAASPATAREDPAPVRVLLTEAESDWWEGLPKTLRQYALNDAARKLQRPASIAEAYAVASASGNGGGK